MEKDRAPKEKQSCQNRSKKGKREMKGEKKGMKENKTAGKEN